jgi:hypothetical protein
MMRLQRFLSVACLVGFIGGAAVLALTNAVALAAEDRPPRVEVELTESFYRALQAEGSKTYGTDKSEAYLRQIAVSARYTVESNLKIIKQQERIIALLEKLTQSKQ